MRAHPAWPFPGMAPPRRACEVLSSARAADLRELLAARGQVLPGCRGWTEPAGGLLSMKLSASVFIFVCVYAYTCIYINSTVIWEVCRHCRPSLWESFLGLSKGALREGYCNPLLLLLIFRFYYT